MTFDPFANIGAAQVSQGGVYFLDGSYLVEIETCTVHQGATKLSTIIEARIITSTNPERPPGMKCSQVINMTQQAALGNVKGFLAALNGIPVNETERVNQFVTREMTNFVFGPTNPGKGRRVRLQCTTTATRPKLGANGQPLPPGQFTKHSWSPALPGDMEIPAPPAL